VNRFRKGRVLTSTSLAFHFPVSIKVACEGEMGERVRVVLCCGETGCASVELKGDVVEICSESGTARLTTEEWNLLVSKIKNGEL
jgi:hypothetical protein